MSTRYVSVALHEKPRMSYRKFLERRIIQAWKALSQAARKHERASLLPEDFVLLTVRRRSIRHI
ncbi:hypothetical protein SCP_0904300 [Sparassis crispa]|uniref:Uncharacterized protein n=1 Tax=Sparassis crispa TaxID=139825 RepID=A0A401GWF9_9APHY|nr:hypothetical protein SCP_0904300 [Sparassis crispa]GBE86551.1 hypothetical protein SCP_0904300 [Sparassis crispa]